MDAMIGFNFYSHFFSINNDTAYNCYGFRHKRLVNEFFFGHQLMRNIKKHTKI